VIRRVKRAAIGFVALLAAIVGLVWWFEHGPGFRRECARLAEAAGILPGMTVAEVGAGAGRVAVDMAARVGPSGRVYATELGDWKFEELGASLKAAGLSNATAVKAGVSTVGLAPDCCDVVYMRRVYHHLGEPAATASGIRTSLRPGGRLVVIDMLTPGWFPEVFQHGVAPEVVRSELESAGFVFERSVGRWSPMGYCLVFRNGR